MKLRGRQFGPGKQLWEARPRTWLPALSCLGCGSLPLDNWSPSLHLAVPDSRAEEEERRADGRAPAVFLRRWGNVFCVAMCSQCSYVEGEERGHCRAASTSETCLCLMTSEDLSCFHHPSSEMLRVGGVPLLLLVLGYILIKQLVILLLRGLPFS